MKSKNDFFQLNGKIKEAISILKSGGIVIFPTDTAFGVGCRMDDKGAVERLLKLKRRPRGQAMPILVDSVEMAQKYLLPFSEEVLKLVRKYWPGGLTIVLPCEVELVPEIVRGGGQTLGVRWPDHLVAKKLIHGLGVPLLGTSANFHGEMTPHKFSDLTPRFLKEVDFVLGGDCRVGTVSTVIDCSKKPWKIIRQGAIRINF